MSVLASGVLDLVLDPEAGNKAKVISDFCFFFLFKRHLKNYLLILHIERRDREISFSWFTP